MGQTTQHTHTQEVTLPETTNNIYVYIASANQWLENDVAFWDGHLIRGELSVSFGSSFGTQKLTQNDSFDLQEILL